MKAFQKLLQQSIEKLNSLAKIHSTGWIVESKHHVNVGKGNGLNGTDFAIKSPLGSACAQVFKTREEAEKHGADYYLVDGDNNPIYMIFTQASEFFTREAEDAKELLIFCKEREQVITSGEEQ